MAALRIGRSGPLPALRSGIEAGDAVTTGVLRLVHRDVRVGEQVLGGRLAAARRRDADARRDREAGRLAVALARRSPRAAARRRRRPRRCRSPGAAPRTRRRRAGRRCRWRAGAHAAACAAEQITSSPARWPWVSLIALNRRGRSAAPRAPRRSGSRRRPAAQLLLEAAPVEKTRERVVVGEVGELVLEAPALGRVLEGDHGADDLVALADRGAQQVDAEGDAVGARTKVARRSWTTGRGSSASANGSAERVGAADEVGEPCRRRAWPTCARASRPRPGWRR